MQLLRRRMLIGSALAVAWSVCLYGGSSAEEAKRPKILMFTRSAGFEHSAVHRDGDELSHSERVFTELGKQHGFDVVATKDGRIFDGDLDQFDAFLFYTTEDLTQNTGDRQPAMSPEGKQRFLDAIAAGKGFIGTHSASDTFHSPGHHQRRYEAQPERDPYIEMIGGEFISHGPQQPGRQSVTSPDFPGLDGIGSDLTMNEEWYSLKNYADDLHVILAQDTQGMEGRDYQRPPFPSTWARMHGQGRVFYTSMGHREDVWDNPQFQQILLGGVAWALKQKDIDITPNMKSVTPGAMVMPQ